MKYIIQRDQFKTGIQVIKEDLVLEKSGDWRETYDELPSWKNSAIGRLFSFITRKTVEKAQGLKINKLVNELEEAFNAATISELEKDEAFKKALESTERGSFFKGLFNKLKSAKDIKDIKKVENTLNELKSENVEYANNPPKIFSIMEQIISSKIKANTSSNTNSSVEEPGNVASNTSTSNFIMDLISSNDPSEFLSEENIKKQFFIDLKGLLTSFDYGKILISYLDKKTLEDLNKLQIFSKKQTKNAGTEEESETTSSTISNSDESKEASLKRQQELKAKRLAKQKEIQNKQNAGTETDTSKTTKEKIGALEEAISNIDADSLSLRSDSLKKLIDSLKKFFADKRVNKEQIADKFFKRSNKLYNSYLVKESTNEKNEESSDEKSDTDTESLLPTIYNDLNEDERKTADEINDAIHIDENGLVKYDDSKMKFIEDKFNDEIFSEMKESKEKVENNKELEDKAEKLEKETAIDPLEIIRVFNKANKAMVVNYMPSNRSGGEVSKRVANDYETLDGGVPALANNNGPYRNKNLFNKWNDGVLSLLKKYQERLKANKYIIYKDDGTAKIDVSKSPISKFINDMLNDSKSTAGGRDKGAQTAFLESYFNIKDEYVSQYKNKYGDPFSNTNSKGEQKELTTMSTSDEASFKSTKKDGSDITQIIVSKMRDIKSGFAFAFSGTVTGYPKYESKTAKLYCVGVKTYAKDYILCKMSFNNDQYLRAYSAGIKIASETEDEARLNQVFLMLFPYNAIIKKDSIITAKIMPCVKAENLTTASTYTIKISDIKNLSILLGKDGLMMKMDRIDKTKKTGKDVLYAKDETFNNILSKLTSK